MKLIGVDLDDVLGDYMGSLIKYHNKTYGTTLTKDKFNSYKFWKVWGGTLQEAIDKVVIYYQTKDFKNMKTVLGAVESVKELKKSYDLVLITSRQDEIKEITKDWINKNFPNMFSYIYFTYNEYTKIGNGKKKSQVCLDLGIPLLIEDSLEYAKDCASKNIEVLLLDQPWNQGNLPNDVQRVYSWKEIEEKISYFTSKNIEF